MGKERIGRDRKGEDLREGRGLDRKGWDWTGVDGIGFRGVDWIGMDGMGQEGSGFKGSYLHHTILIKLHYPKKEQLSISLFCFRFRIILTGLHRLDRWFLFMPDKPVWSTPLFWGRPAFRL